MRRHTLTALLALVALLTSCSSTKVYTNVDPSADFSRYATYGFNEPLGTDEQNYESLVTQFLKRAVARELEARGYTASDRPDLLVNFYLHSQEKLSTSTTPTAYYGYRGYGGYGTWGGYGGYETTVTSYTEGTLNIDLVDAHRKQLVWEGAAVGRVTEKVRKELEKSVDETVALVFAEYPFTASR